MRGLRLVVLGAVFVGLAAPAGAAAPRLNVVVIMADDLDVHALDTMVALGRMPAFKANFLDSGIRFTQSFVTNALCCPSRATFLTGQYSHNHGALSNTRPNGGVTRLRDESTLATWLDEAGYRTGYIGKYLNGYGLNWVNVPDSPLPQHDPRYRPPGWDDWQGLVDPTTYRVYNYVISDNGTLVRYGRRRQDYQTDVLAERAASFITRTPGPFFLAVNPLAPHIEVEGVQTYRWRNSWQWAIRPAPRHEDSVTVGLLPALKPSFNEPDLSDKPVWRPQLDAEDLAGAPGTPRGGLLAQYRSRLASLRAVDDLIQRVFRALRITGRLANTVVIFTSDNGYLYGEHRLSGKLAAYEESIRVPLYVHVPWSAQPRTVDRLVTNADLAPTIAELAGAVPALPVDGRSFAPLLHGETPADWRRRFLVEHWWNDSVYDMPTFAAVRTGPEDGPTADTLYVEYYDQNYGQAVDDVPDPVMFRELYDLQADPFQLDSLHREAARTAQMETLSHLLAGLRTCGSASGQTACREVER
jgi:arylsulfatase A-like enzyme